MERVESAGALGPRHHAVLYALIAREVISALGPERGEPLVLRATTHYGEGRGRRMARRARADGTPLSMAAYLRYGEWSDPNEEAVQESAVEDSDLRVSVRGCPWHLAWQAHDLLDYGKLYCRVIDEALVRGFNPDLRLNVESTAPNGAESCRFSFCDGALDAGESAGKGRQIMSWPYHCAHLVAAMGDVLRLELGDTGDQMIASALSAFSELFDGEATMAICALGDLDFTKV